MKKWLLVGAAFAALTGLVLAQPVGQATLSGNECWNTGQGPGGTTTGFVCTNMVRNTVAQVAGTLGAGINPILGVTAGWTQLAQGGVMLNIGQPAANTITLPPNPVPDGARIQYCNGTNAAFATNVVTIVANTNQTLNQAITVTTQAANSCLILQWYLAATTWYRVQ